MGAERQRGGAAQSDQEADDGDGVGADAGPRQTGGEPVQRGVDQRPQPGVEHLTAPGARRPAPAR
ncbi:MAG TPA: hypothetical protein VEH84_12060, partial [Alphaproteobacteria bacterium]|nr:hypothetical protein [Alphaproteobacteria bacterium]